MTNRDQTTGQQVRRTTFVEERTWAAFGEFKAGIIGRKGENAVARALTRLGLPALHDAILADPFGLTQVDHLVCALEAIIVIETKTYAGHITGTPYSHEWVQHLAGGETRHALLNPLHQNHRHCRAVEATIADFDVPIAGIVVSAGSATFCDELQGVVVQVDRLGEAIHRLPSEAQGSAMLEKAWLCLLVAVTTAETRREEHGEMVRRRREGSTL